MVGHWLHFGYGDMMEMETSMLMAFVDETEALAKSE